MGHRCCGKQKVKRGLWSPEEDEKLVRYITNHGHASWSSVPKLAGLQRCGKSCRLRWINYLRPDLKRGSFTAEEEQIIIDVHRILGNRWAQIAKHLPGRTDNEVKNFWNSCIKKKLISQGLDPRTHNLMPSHKRASTSNNSKATWNNNILSKTQHLHELPNEPPATFSIITVNSQNSRDSSMKVNPPVLSAPPTPPPLPTMPPPPPPPLPPDYHHQEPNQFLCSNLTNNVQNCHDPSFFSHASPNQNAPAIDSSLPFNHSSSSINTSMLGLLDENHYYNMWDGNEITNGAFQAPTMQTHEQGKEQVKDTAIDELVDKGSSQDPMDVSFDSSSFDLDFTTLISSALSNDFNSMDDFAWPF